MERQIYIIVALKDVENNFYSSMLELGTSNSFHQQVEDSVDYRMLQFSMLQHTESSEFARIARDRAHSLDSQRNEMKSERFL